MSSNTPVLETISAQAAAGRLLRWWQDTSDPLAPGGWLSLVGEGAADGGQVLREVGAQVASSVLVDATERTAEELLGEVLAALGLESRRYGGLRWISEVRALPERRLVLLTHVHRMGRTRRSYEAERLLTGTLKALCARTGLQVIAQVDAPGLLRSGDAGLRLEPAGADPAPTPPAWPDEVRALALAEPRTVPPRAWAALVAGLRADAGRPVTEDALPTVPAAYERWLERREDGVGFVDEAVAESLRRETAPETVTRVNRHMTAWLRTLAPELAHPDGWAASGALGTYAAAGLAMHAAQADHEQKWTTQTLDELVARGELVAHLPQTALLDAARCAHYGGIGSNSAAADAAYLWDYGVVPASQTAWAAWLHLMATARGDEDFVAGLLASGIRLPWKAVWTRWRPPGGFHTSFLAPGVVGETAEVRWHGRPAVAALGTPEVDVSIWDAQTGEPLAGPWPEDSVVPEDAQAALTWPDESGTGDPITTLAALEAAVPGTDTAHPSLLSAPVLTVGELAILGGPGGLFALAPAKGWEETAGTPCRAPLSGPYAAAGPTTPRHATPPGAADLRAVVGGDAFRPVKEDQLPAGLAEDGAREVLTGIGVPAFDESGLRLAPDDDAFLTEFTWPDDAAEDPESEGPFFRLGRWMGGDVVLDGTGGAVFRVTDEDDPVDGALVASSLENFLAMAAQWLTGLRISATVDNSDEQYALRQHVSGELWMLDDAGSQSDAWMYIFEND
ncbi:SUKH-4 family immunity protein [Streptomyces sp. Je 1-4]|uniref:SUKH-4 family immunity protein n=1 Tax=Streptomyces TaxID=1883 RepID=UPI0021D855C6|nr:MULTISPECIES: SUKH-4 family immunity protein [unclassified Streptomyces]UYB42322.1 SUKH-4 family immunity protein [Streptomyces sp. Je 1-4]UZQ38620.1 SUKH-4 family immunity protein [Streptomyces sp. Je 1-4] [Streptomyces sp. Je 1-4 4N24]UZQ46037.1 SUKH-4 family immunity protein [Streptomyces sp. Je 1-4] [Streptomyces sp. Je 1-4 4N24_ara]